MTTSTLRSQVNVWHHPVIARHAPVIVVVLALIAIWYVATVLANTSLVRDAFEREEIKFSTLDLIVGTLGAERPLVVAPHQMLAGVAGSGFGSPRDCPR